MSNFMKKILMLLLPVCACMLLLTGCGPAEQESAAAPEKTAAAPEKEMQEAWGEEWGYLSEEEMKNLPTPTEPPPLEVIGGMEHEVGEMLEGEIKMLALTLKNISDKPWKIQEIDTNCDCTNVDGIPGGLLLSPGQEWKMRVRVDSSRLPVGKFRREIIVVPLRYLPVRIAISGQVQRFASFTPANKRLKFPSMMRPDEKWETVGFISIPEDNEVLQLKMDDEASGYVTGKLHQVAPRKWEVVVTPARPLPYGRNFSEKKRIAVTGKDGRVYPPLEFTVAGECGVALNFNEILLNFDDMKRGEDGMARCEVYIGFDPYAANFTDKQMRAMQTMLEKVDFEDFKEKVTFKAPDGVQLTVKKERYRVLLEVAVPTRKIENSAENVVVTAEAYGNKVSELKLRPAKKSR
jgi:hypothetical protein